MYYKRRLIGLLIRPEARLDWSDHRVFDIVNALNKILKTDIRPEYAPKRHGDVRTTYADISRMKRLLGIKKLVKFEEGLELTVKWFKERG